MKNHPSFRAHLEIRGTLLAWCVATGLALPAMALETVKTWKAGTGTQLWHSGHSWDTDNPLDGGFPDSDDVAVFDTLGGEIRAFFGVDYDAAYCNKLDVRQGDVLLDGQGLPLRITAREGVKSVLEVDSATLALDHTAARVDVIRLAPKPWDVATLELRADSRIVGGNGYGIDRSFVRVGDEGRALLVLRSPGSSLPAGAAMLENFNNLEVGNGPSATSNGTLVLDAGASLRTWFLSSAWWEGSVASIVIHEGATIQASSTRLGSNGSASLNLMGTLDSTSSCCTAEPYPSNWALWPGGSALVTIDGGLYEDDDKIHVGKAVVQIENGGQLIGTDINLAQKGDGYVELYASASGEVIARGRLVVAQDGYTRLNASSGANIESQVGVIAEAAGSEAEVTLTGENTRWLSSGDTGEMNIGWYGNATLDVTNGASLENDWGFVARASGEGIARIDGPGSAWINHGNLTVGNGGGSSGALTVANGASVECANSQIGRFTGSSGFVDVHDPGSTWTVREELLVGGTGQGSLQISNGGRVEGTLRAIISSNPGSTGLAVVSGPDSTWHTNAALHVGGESGGRLRVLDGGRVENNWAFLGVAAGVSGEATVSGPSSQWISNSNMAIGHHGTGSVVIQNGGYAQGRDLLIGRYFDGIGEVSVEDGGSTMTSSGLLRVGLDGQGSLDVAGGGTVQAGLDFMVASGAGSTGTATISGADSMLDVGRSLYVGGNAGAAGGVGTLTVAQLAAATVADTLKLWPEGTLELIGDGRITTSFFDLTGGGSFDFDDGTLTVTNGAYTRPAFGDACNETIDGTNPRLALSNASLDLGQCTLMVGNHESGALSVDGTESLGGASVHSGVVFIAEHTESTGTVQLSGDSSVLETDVVIVANGGTGELSVGPGSHVEVGALTQIGLSPFGTGRISVEGSFDTDTLIVGDEGTGGLQIQTGGSLRSNVALVARRTGSTGSVLIADGGSWMVNGSCYVGDFSDGTPSGTGDIRVGQNRPVGPATFAVADELVVGSPDSEVTVQNGNLTAASIILDAGARLTMYGGSVRTGSVVLNGGSLGLYAGTLTTPLVLGNLFTEGTILSPGEPIGTLQVEGSFGQGGRGGPFPPGSSTLEFRGTPGAIEHDSIMVSGTATLGGAVHLRAIADFVPSPDDTFVLLRADTLEGTFWNAAPGMYLRIEGSPIECRVDYGPTSPFDANEVVLSECRGTGDADGNGLTNLNDFAGMPACLAGPAERVDDVCLAYDLDLSSFVDLRDYARVQNNGITRRR